MKPYRRAARSTRALSYQEPPRKTRAAETPKPPAKEPPPVEVAEAIPSDGASTYEAPLDEAPVEGGTEEGVAEAAPDDVGTEEEAADANRAPDKPVQKDSSEPA